LFDWRIVGRNNPDIGLYYLLMRSDIFTLNTDMNSYKDLILSEDGILF